MLQSMNLCCICLHLYATVKLYAEVVKVTSLPENASVPAPALMRYWLVEKPCCWTKWSKKSMRSPLKAFTSLGATKEYTVICPSGPLYRLQSVPAMVVVASAVGSPSAPCRR